MRHVPGIAGRQEAMARQLEAERKLMGDEFPQQNGAGLLPAPYTRRVFFGEPVGEERGRSEEHTSELQSHSDLVCRLLLEKKKKKKKKNTQLKKKKHNIQKTKI